MNEKTVLDIEYVKRAMNGDEEAFKEIYNITYYNKLFIAKKYMKNDTAAEDVLQEAYIKIWKYLPSLDDPANFSAWSSKIVANTALNELRKNQPMPFTDLAAEGDDGSEMSFDVEDSYELNQPELAYTEQEEQNIVREMIEALSDEQRMCIMMYYIEELSVKEIAEALGCSEGTVKSRLNYGRKNIKLRAEDMQKRGYNFKGISALALLLFLIKKQAVNSYAAPVAVMSGGAAASGGAVGGTVGSVYGGSVGNGAAGTAAGSSGVGAASQGTVGKNAVKKAFLKTAAGKVILGIAAAAVVGGTIAAVILANKKDDDKPETVVDNTTTLETVIVTTEDSSEITTGDTSEAITEEISADTTETTTEATTEVTTEAAQTIDPAYAEAYAGLLEANSAAIQAHEVSTGQFGREPEKTVVIYDVFGDRTPELLFITSTNPDWEWEPSAEISVYTMKDGKAILVSKGQYNESAGSGQRNRVYAAKSKEAVYWSYIPTHGTSETDYVTKKIEYDYLTNKTKEQEICHGTRYPEEKAGDESAYSHTYLVDDNNTDEATYTAINEEWRADYGDLLFENYSSYSSENSEREDHDYLYSYDEAVTKLEELKNAEAE